jgi:hypothetical protein
MKIKRKGRVYHKEGGVNNVQLTKSKIKFGKLN